MKRSHTTIAPAGVSAALHERHQPLAKRRGLPAACRNQLTAALRRQELDPAAALDLIVDLRRLTHCHSPAGLARLLPAFEALLARATARRLGVAWGDPRPYRTLFV